MGRQNFQSTVQRRSLFIYTLKDSCYTVRKIQYSRDCEEDATEDCGRVLGKKGDYEKEDEHLDTNTDDPHKHECERSKNSDTNVIMSAKITYADKIQSYRAFFDDKVPIVDLGTLSAVIMEMHEKQ